MNRSETTRASARPLGTFARVRQWVQTGWRRTATVAAALLAVGMGYHVIFGQNGLTSYLQKKQETLTLDEQLHGLQRENELLKGHVDRLQNDPNAIEHQAREELHYTRPGEVIYTLPSIPQKDVAGQQGDSKR